MEGLSTTTRARIVRYMAEKVSNFPDELNNESRCHCDEVNLGTNIISEDSSHILNNTL